MSAFFRRCIDLMAKHTNNEDSAEFSRESTGHFAIIFSSFSGSTSHPELAYTDSNGSDGDIHLKTQSERFGASSLFMFIEAQIDAPRP